MNKRIKRIYSLVFIMRCIVILALPGCNIMNEKLQPNPIISTCPASRNAVLQENEVISVEFSAPVDHSSAETVFQLSSLEGRIDGRYNWKDTCLQFFPDAPLKEGNRYSLKMCGTVRLKNGKARLLHTIIPFYYLRKSDYSDPPVEYHPMSGSSLQQHTPIQITFPEQVERSTTAQHIQLSPLTACTMEWNEGSNCLTLIPENGWNQHTVYSVEFLSSTHPSAHYISDYELPDSIEIEIAKVTYDWNEDFPVIGSETENIEIDTNQTLQFSFSEEIDHEEFEAAFSLDPLCSGSFYWKGPYTAVFIPNRELPPSTLYRCRLEPYSECSLLNDASFVPCSQFKTARASATVVKVYGETGDVFPDDIQSLINEEVVITPAGADGLYSLTIEYDHGVHDEQSRSSVQNKANVSSVFPPDLPPPALVGFLWTDPQHLLIQMQGFGVQAENRECYYSFSLPEDVISRRSVKLKVMP